MTTTIVLIMFVVGALILYIGRPKVSEVPDQSVFKAGMISAIALFGIAWLTATFIAAHEDYIISTIGSWVTDWTSPMPSGFAGCYDDGGYVHENQCFVYHGPDTAYTGREICLASRGWDPTLDIVDITNPAATVRLDSFAYQTQGSTFAHQAWFTEDHRYIVLNDEFDESDNGHNTRTWIFDAVDLYSALQKVTDMKPVVVNPHVTFEQLAKEIVEAKDDDYRRTALREGHPKGQPRGQAGAGG